MGRLNGQGEQAIADLARRYGVSTDAVRTLLDAVRLGGGTQAQFSHPELGGGGQWMAGGMTMVGDMFNHGLQATVSGLAAELSSLLASTQLYAPASPPAAGGQPGATHPANLNNWWPGDLGQPSSTGSQNESRYAVFPAGRRLAVRGGDGDVRVYDTLDHRIAGVQQQQGGRLGTLTFSSQHGTFPVESLPLVSPAPQPPAPAVNPSEPAPAPVGGTDSDAILAAIEKVSDLHRRGVLSDDEFTAKKAELLARL
ncbi:Short C-terminal domain-containing protein [Parafrankia irregularis]|uniref:Short C-terminal domain-containing protein n=1 Tax=Parafrankia irregularis TaxID=795642 RepID=A0A0S4QI06_9ACTN|nr:MULTISPECIES: SHOCT domain-containing protein [Parafrankia]MBE3200696.1 SHOCT domain-containing protein [Parafrankia sp. CH37]CUU54921.1 Short C-terminal domain-containing protein [Parafrankia irregularis]